MDAGSSFSLLFVCLFRSLVGPTEELGNTAIAFGGILLATYAVYVECQCGEGDRSQCNDFTVLIDPQPTVLKLDNYVCVVGYRKQSNTETQRLRRLPSAAVDARMVSWPPGLEWVRGPPAYEDHIRQPPPRLCIKFPYSEAWFHQRLDKTVLTASLHARSNEAKGNFGSLKINILPALFSKPSWCGPSRKKQAIRQARTTRRRSVPRERLGILSEQDPVLQVRQNANGSPHYLVEIRLGDGPECFPRPVTPNAPVQALYLTPAWNEVTQMRPLLTISSIHPGNDNCGSPNEPTYIKLVLTILDIWLANLDNNLQGLHIYLCIHAFLKYRESALDVRKARIHYVRVMFITLFLSTATFALDLGHFYVSTEFNSRKTKTSIEIALYVEVAFHLFIGFTHLTADGLLVWRCYVIWTGKKWLGLIPLLPYAASIVGILDVVSNALCLGRDPNNVICKNHGVALHRGLYYLAATSVNLAATVLICIRLLRTRRWMKRVLGSEDTSNSEDAATTELVGGPVVPYTRVAIVLIESALPFTLLGIAAAIVAFANTRSANNAHIFASRLWNMASGLAAQVIIYRVIAGTSWTSSREGDRYALSHSINFLHTSNSRARSGIQNYVP
ncbi:hypothetical protein BKA70DRAFT_1521554 [Coprinopsis sp. MPI-PUGE-AT-0042]|nr:hypothetical protein BKA70DRAFT_1521554 [Coprinopsis sp. MPI-PUGE-AT-0042]